MISFDAFVKAIHDAILGANDALMDRNIDLLDRFFDEVEHEHAASAPDEKDSGDSHVSHIAKSVCILYPRQNPAKPGGIEEVEVHVPLITLVPLSMSQIEKVKLTADFEIHMSGDELQLNFPSGGSTPKRWMFSRRARKTTTGKLEITISPHSVSEGIKIVVEGYERALRAQIPD